MQLHLDTAELNLVADLLLKTDRTSRSDAELLDKILARDLRLDGNELERLGELLAKHKTELKAEIAHTQESAACEKKQAKLSVLEGALERINEACVMF